MTWLTRHPPWSVFLVVCWLAAAGCRSERDAAPGEQAPALAQGSATSVAPARVVDIVATEAGFLPASVDAKPGEALLLRFTRTATSGCLSSIAVPAAKIERPLPMGEAVDVAVSAPSTGELGFQCGMGMVKGRVVVAGPTSEPSKQPIDASVTAAHADHDPRHGGVLTMEGDYHVEIVVAADGRITLWVSDAVRDPVPVAELGGFVEVRTGGAKAAGDAQRLTLSGEGQGTLVTKGPAPTVPREYTWQLTARGQPLRMTLVVPKGGTAAITAGSSKPAAPPEPKPHQPHGPSGHAH
ncbi:MAG: cupredoxin domain-containing protein [Polyangiaceae bacterium]